MAETMKITCNFYNNALDIPVICDTTTKYQNIVCHTGEDLELIKQASNIHAKITELETLNTALQTENKMYKEKFHEFIRKNIATQEKLDAPLGFPMNCQI